MQKNIQDICKKYAKKYAQYAINARNKQDICKKYAQYTKICEKYAINVKFAPKCKKCKNKPKNARCMRNIYKYMLNMQKTIC